MNTQWHACRLSLALLLLAPAGATAAAAEADAPGWSYPPARLGPPGTDLTPIPATPRRPATPLPPASGEVLGTLSLPHSLTLWRQLDERLLQATARFRQLHELRERLMANLDETRRSWQPGVIDLQAMRSRHEIDMLLAQLHELVGQEREHNDHVARLLRLLLSSSHRWQEGLEPALRRAQRRAPPAERERIGRWLEGLKGLAADNPRLFLEAVIGEDYALYLVETVPALLRPIQATPENQRRWLTRLTQLQAQQEELREELTRRDLEIDRLRRLIEGEEEPFPQSIPEPLLDDDEAPI